MPQETNLNVSPYFDDFDEDKNFHKVLFKPSYPIQARELTTLQTILQNQVERFGSHFFKEGSVVIPGQTNYIDVVAVEINSLFAGIPVISYTDQLVGLTIKGRSSGVTAKILDIIEEQQSERNSLTLYVSYIDTSTDGTQINFFDNEVLEATTAIEVTSNVFISVGEGFASTKIVNAVSPSSAFTIEEGIYFIRGHFVKVHNDILILNQYDGFASYRLGLSIEESLVNYYDDSSLTDNAKGFSNFSAPGADRLKITATLDKKTLDDFDDKNFIQLAEVRDGELLKVETKTDYNIIGEELARRTYDESGDYYVKSFNLSLKNTLNDGLNSDGIYKLGETTRSGNSPDESLATYKISPGKAYVKGYEVETISHSFVDINKPRVAKTVTGQAVNFDFGPSLMVNRAYGAPQLGFNTTEVLYLQNTRIGSSDSARSGTEIGVARAYDFYLDSGSYDSSTPDSNRWNISLFDVQLYTVVTINTSISLDVPSKIIGENSGATAYLRSSVTNSTSLTLYSIEGEFVANEPIRILTDEADENENFDRRYITGITRYGYSDVKSIFSNTSGANFNADVIQSLKLNVGSATIAAKVGSTSEVTISPEKIQKIKTGDIVSFSTPGQSDPTYAVVSSKTLITIFVDEVTTVTGVNYGTLPSSQLVVSDFKVLESKLSKTEYTGNPADNNSLFSAFPKPNVASVEFNNSSIVIRREFSVTITSNSTGIISANANETFLPFDEDRYTLIRSDNTYEVLTADKFQFTQGSTELKINNLGSNSTCRLIATMRKTNVSSKKKLKEIVGSTIISASSNKASGSTQNSLNDGLIYDNYPYGTRVQDEEIGLVHPDVVEIHAIYESINTADPEAPLMTLTDISGSTGTTTDFLVGEQIVGRTSGAIAKYLGSINDTQSKFVYQNSKVFLLEEIIDFKSSSVSAKISSIVFNSKDITSSYTLEGGQQLGYYGYSKLVRNPGVEAPSRKLKVFFSRGYYDPSDSGDITTVESYSAFDYGKEIPKINGLRVTDLVDLRPRVNTYTLAGGIRSPFEFFGRDFSSGLHSTPHVISKSDSLSLNFSYYLPRYDSIFVDKNGVFSVVSGTSKDDPKIIEPVPGSMRVADVFLPPYLYSVKDAQIRLTEHKRYQMKDISKIDKRLQTVEKITSLSLLEANTENLFVDDGTGLNRFKSGFFVDNFTTLKAQDVSGGVRNSIDTKKGILRPSHNTTHMKLEVSNDSLNNSAQVTVNQKQDYRYTGLLANNMRRTGDLLTLNYSDVSWLKQPFATRIISVTPYLVRDYTGSIQLNPDTDVWIDTRVIQPNNVTLDGSFEAIASALQVDIVDSGDGLRSGVSPVLWNSWETTGINSQEITTTTDRNDTTAGAWGTITTTNNIELNQTRDGLQYSVSESIQTESLGERIVSRELDTVMRSINIEFVCSGLKPFTKMYPYFDGIDVSDFCFNKLIKIQMISGTFQVGETAQTDITGDQVRTFDNTGTFRIASSNHKEGSYLSPTRFYGTNIYERDSNVSSEYSTNSTTLNIDTFSLSEETEVDFNGNLVVGAIIRGLTSGAEARIVSTDLISDEVGSLTGSFRVPDPTVSGYPIFETGRSTLRLTNSNTNSEIPGSIQSFAEAIFYSQGSTDVSQNTTLSIRNAEVEVNTDFTESQNINFPIILDQQAVPPPPPPPPPPRPPLPPQPPGRDPLAQTFTVWDDSGIFVTKVDLFFKSKAEKLPVMVEIREVELGLPSKKILPFSKVDLLPEQINISDDSSVSTTVAFKAPVYLESKREYALILLSDSTDYEVWISQMGEIDVSTLSNNQNQILVSSQPILGSLFKSQNASTWTPSQYEDLKFELYRAEFSTNPGSVQLLNSKPTRLAESTKNDPLRIESSRIRVSTSSTITSTDFDYGSTIYQTRTGVGTATGTVVGYGGSITQFVVTGVGVGYTPGSGSFTYSNISLTTKSGKGVNATADITVTGGVIANAVISGGNGGSGFNVGDVLSVPSLGNNPVGVNGVLTVSDVLSRKEIEIDEIQGEFVQSGTYQLEYLNSGLTKTPLNGGAVYISDAPVTVTDGTHIKIHHKNHGMYSNVNIVSLKDVQSDIQPVTLSSDYLVDAVGNIPVSNTVNFRTFENLPISPLNPGYVKIDGELLSYTGYTNTELTGVQRAQDSTKAQSHYSGSFVSKYELGSISLRRINKTHDLRDVTLSDPITKDSYYIKIDMGTRSDLKLNKTLSSIGGQEVKISYNKLYDAITPSINEMIPAKTNISYTMSSVTGTSIGSNKSSWQAAPLTFVQNNKINYLESTRVLGSANNETQFLGDFAYNKSIVFNATFSTLNSKLTPIIDLARTDIVLISNIVNNPNVNYAEDASVASITEDPHLFTYVTKPIILQNPASGIKVILDAYLNEDSDLRVFYSTGGSNRFVPFPGYRNYNSSTGIDPSISDGTSDLNIKKSDAYSFEPGPSEFIEHEYTIDDISSFTEFRIKIVGSTDNSSYVPQVRNLRAIALGAL